MLSIRVAVGDEVFNEETQTFENTEYAVIELEHSLVSLSKWESEFEKPFLSDSEKTSEETLAYIMAMTLTDNVPLETFLKLSEKNVAEINEYIQKKMTATTFVEGPKKPNREIMTAEVIYYMMIAHNIPIEWENRHLSQLITLIRVCNEKNKPPEKVSKSELAARNRQLNAQRKAKYKTRG